MSNKQSNQSIFDKHTNDKLFELDQKLAAYYLEHIPANLSALKQAYIDTDISEIRFQSHKLIPAMVLIDKQEIAKSLRKLSDESINIEELQRIADNVIGKIELVLKTLKI